MKARVTIEYDIPDGDRTALRDQEEQRWISSETLLQLHSAVVRVKVIDESGLLSGAGGSAPVATERADCAGRRSAA